MDTDTLDAFWLFVYERQEVFYKRSILHQRAPWTEDSVIAQARFTNVYRELDRGTKFLVEEILENKDVTTSVTSAITNILVYRFFNRIDTWLDIQPFVNIYEEAHTDEEKKLITDEIYRVLTERRIANKKLYTGAYMAVYCPNLGGIDKTENAAIMIRNISEHARLISQLIRSPRGSTKGIYEYLIANLKGFGRFLAFQCALDFTYPLLRQDITTFAIEHGDGLAYRKIAPLANQYAWVKAGPGCVSGLQILQLKDAGIDKVNCAEMMNMYHSQRHHFNRLGLDMKFMRTCSGQEIILSPTNIEHSLCEFQKWWRMIGGGHIKTIWTAPSSIEWKSKFDTLPAYGKWSEGENT